MVIDPYGKPVNEYPYFSYSEMQFTLLLSPNEGKDDICSHPGEMSQDEIERIFSGILGISEVSVIILMYLFLMILLSLKKCKLLCITHNFVDIVTEYA